VSYKKLEKRENIDKNAVKNIMNLNIKNILRVEKIYCQNKIATRSGDIVR